ncbi:MAG: ATP-dependent DNA helicase RecQ, partial [Flavobacteriales bacterium]
MINEATVILKKHWGHDSFRSPQDEIILNVLNHHDTLALMPTGGGKSICFQVPALIKPGICVVVSPLIALIKDQVENLRKRGIMALMVHSGMNAREIDITLDNAAYGNYKFLYLSPERLATDLFRARLKKMNVNLLVVDEAHCVSQWGYDFRPAYLRIPEIRELIPAVPVLALTATATPLVATDIQEKLKLKNGRLVQASFERKNLAYVVRRTDNKNGELVHVAKKLNGSGIVYVRSRRKTAELSEWLRHSGISSIAYHAGMTHQDRDNAQAAWIKNTTQVIVATNAFGMGIDKPDVRWVLHWDVPESPEAYFQEAGRAGRDGSTAFAVSLWNQNDLLELERNHTSAFPEKETIRRIYIALGNFLKLAVGSGKDESFPFPLTAFCETYKLNPLETVNSLKILELAGFISMAESIYEPSRVKIEMKHDDLYNFQLRNAAYDPLIQLLLRSYTGIFENTVMIREHDIANRLHTTATDIKQKLNFLKKSEVIIYREQNELPYVTFLMERISERDFRIPDDAYTFRKERARKRIDAMHNYIESKSKCRSQLLLEYFGEKNTARCGQCDYCLELNKTTLSNVEYEHLQKDILGALT